MLGECHQNYFCICVNLYNFFSATVKKQPPLTLYVGLWVYILDENVIGGKKCKIIIWIIIKGPFSNIGIAILKNKSNNIKRSNIEKFNIDIAILENEWYDSTTTIYHFRGTNNIFALCSLMRQLLFTLDVGWWIYHSKLVCQIIFQESILYPSNHFDCLKAEYFYEWCE